VRDRGAQAFRSVGLSRASALPQGTPLDPQGLVSLTNPPH